jgi:TetR/AcrR family transcriptional regulator
MGARRRSVRSTMADSRSGCLTRWGDTTHVARTPVKARASRATADPRSLGRLQEKRDRIVAAALRAFATNGYAGTRIEAIAADAGVAKGSVFAHFGSKGGLFLETYKTAVRSFPSYLDAPPDILERGFFATLRYWLERTEHLVHDDRVPYRVSLIGNYGVDLDLRRDINRWLADEDPYGTVPLVEAGIERGEVRADVPLDMVVGVVDWLMERFQDAQVTDELDPGLFRRKPGGRALQLERIDQFLRVLQGAIGAEAARTAPPAG